MTEVVTGGARGVDRCGALWARRHRIHVRLFEANWGAYGLAAGPMRNREMAAYAERLIAFRGGAGTTDMIRQARAHGLTVVVAEGRYP